MDKITIAEDIKLFYIQADSFPDDIGDAFQRMMSLFRVDVERRVFGISRPENGKIVYRVAAEELMENELSRHNLPEFTIEKGEYVGRTIKDCQKNITLIAGAFVELTSLRGIDPNGYCMEWYKGSDVFCMVRLVG